MKSFYQKLCFKKSFSPSRISFVFNFCFWNIFLANLSLVVAEVAGNEWKMTYTLVSSWWVSPPIPGTLLMSYSTCPHWLWTHACSRARTTTHTLYLPPLRAPHPSLYVPSVLRKPSRRSLEVHIKFPGSGNAAVRTFGEPSWWDPGLGGANIEIQSR